MKYPLIFHQIKPNFSDSDILRVGRSQNSSSWYLFEFEEASPSSYLCPSGWNVLRMSHLLHVCLSKK